MTALFPCRLAVLPVLAALWCSASPGNGMDPRLEVPALPASDAARVCMEVDALLNRLAEAAADPQAGTICWPGTYTTLEASTWPVIQALAMVPDALEALRKLPPGHPEEAQRCALLARALLGDRSVKSQVTALAVDEHAGMMRAWAVLALEEIAGAEDIELLMYVAVTDPLQRKHGGSLLGHHTLVYPVRLAAQHTLQAVQNRLDAAPDPPTTTESLLARVESGLLRIADDLGPGVSVEADGRAVLLLYNTRTFMVHGADKLGHRSRTAHESFGPAVDGLLVNVSLQDGCYFGAALVPQDLRQPYWTTFVNAYPVDSGRQHLHVTMSYGSRTDRELLGQIKAMLESMVDDAPASPTEEKIPAAHNRILTAARDATWTL